MVDTLVTRLPNELILEILRNRVLRPRDLVNCALVSRCYLDAVRERLYQSVQILAMKDWEDATSEDGEEEAERMELSTETYKLTRSLVENPRLGKLVRELRFRVGGGYGSRAELLHSTVAITPDATILTFLQLAPDVDKVQLDLTWPVSLDTLAVMSSQENVKNLIIASLCEDEVRYVVENLAHLQHLEVWTFREPLPQERPDGLNSLKTLTSLCCRDHVRGQQLPLLTSSSSILRRLQANTFVTRDIQYSHHTALQELEVLTPMQGPLLNRIGAAYNSREIWKAVCESRSLVRLSFAAETSYPDTTDDLTTWIDGDPTWPRTPIPTLRILEFKGNMNLFRIRRLLASPLVTTLTRLVVPSRLALPRESLDPSEVLVLEAIRGMCEGTGIELYLADDLGKNSYVPLWSGQGSAHRSS